MKHSCYIHTMRVTDSAKEVHMHLTPRELDKLMIHTLADVDAQAESQRLEAQPSRDRGRALRRRT